MIIIELTGKDRLTIDPWIQSPFSSTSTGLMLADHGTPPVEMVTLGLMNGAGVKQPSWLSVLLLGYKHEANPKGILISFPWKDGVLHFSNMKHL